MWYMISTWWVKDWTTGANKVLSPPPTFIYTSPKDELFTCFWEWHRGGLDLGQSGWEAIKQASKKVRSQSARSNSHARQHRNTNLYTSSWREGGITCHIKFSQQSRRWGMSPHSNLLHTQQVLTSRLSLACCESNSSGRQHLIRMHTDSS